MPYQSLNACALVRSRNLWSGWSWLWVVSALVFASSLLHGQNLKGDEALSKILVEGEGWQPLAEGYRFTDAACSDRQGNFYFADVAQGNAVMRIDPQGKVSVLLTNTPRISGLKWGPDSKLYACTQNPKKQVVAFEVPSGEMKVLADDVQPNDLVVSRKGFVYFTETGKGQVTLIDPKGGVRPAATGIQSPNGIGLSPSHGTLAVSEYTGSNVWVFRIEADGSLTAGDKYMTLRCPPGSTKSEGDGMTVDGDGRYYVTSTLGIQMFDWTGRLSGIISRPQNKGTVSAAIAGEGLRYLYVCSSDKVYRRPLKVAGSWPFGNP